MIVWGENTKRLLAKLTAIGMLEESQVEPFDKKVMMTVFRNVMTQVLKGNELRYIGGPSRIPWLELYVKDALRSIAKPNQIVPFVPPTPEVEDRAILLVEAMKALMDTFNSALTSQNELILEQSTKIESLVNKIEAMSSRTPVVSQPSKSVKILIFGNLVGPQRSQIEKIGSEHKGVRLVFLNAIRPVKEMPIYDHAIVMEWMVRNGGNTVNRVLNSRFDVANSVSDVSKLIDKFTA